MRDVSTGILASSVRFPMWGRRERSGAIIDIMSDVLSNAETCTEKEMRGLEVLTS